MKISKIPLNRIVGGVASRTLPTYHSPHNKKKYKPEWQMSLLRFASVFAHFSPYVFSLKYEPHTTTMGLYRASQLSVHGEDILEEARNFSNRHLNWWNTHNDQHQARIVRYCGWFSGNYIPFFFFNFMQCISGWSKMVCGGACAKDWWLLEEWDN